MKNLLKKIGKVFVVLDRKDEKDIRHSLLLVDGDSILPNNFALILNGVKNRFKNARITVLTFENKELFIKDNFPGVEVIIPKKNTRKFRLALEMLSLLRRRFDFIIVSSLSVSPVIAGLMFGKCPIFLHNKWFEWYRIRYRTFLDLIRGVKSADKNRRKRNNGIKDILKNTGRFFIILSEVREDYIKSRVLIEDNGYTDIGHTVTAIKQAKEIFVNPDITLLTYDERVQHFNSAFPQIRFVTAGKYGNRFRFIVEMYKMRRQRFSHVVLTTLDIPNILLSLLFMRAEVALYNKWHQWWILDFRGIGGYLKVILKILIMIPMLIYLLSAAGFILLRTKLRMCFMNFKINKAA